MAAASLPVPQPLAQVMPVSPLMDNQPLPHLCQASMLSRANAHWTCADQISSSAKYIQLTVTAGSIPTGSCTASGTGAAALPTAFVDVYKVIAVPVAMAAAAAFV